MRDLQVKALSALWKIRSHPNYLQYPESQEVKLSNILGELPSDPVIISKLLNEQGATQDRLYFTARTTQLWHDPQESGELIKVPEMDDLVKPGILTDVVVATGKKIAADAIHHPYYDDPHKPILELLAENAGMPMEEYKRYTLARLNYNLFVNSYIAHFIKEGTRAEQLVTGPKGPLRQTFIPIDNPATYLKQNFGVEIKL